MSKALDAATVRHMFDYKDGVLYWRTSPAMKVKAGAPAGGLHKRTGRHAITIDGAKFNRARLVWAWHHGTWPEVIKHRNDRPSDDRIENLRNTSYIVLKAEQRINSTLDSLPGAIQKNAVWQAQLCNMYLGTFNTPEEAHAAFLQAYEERHGTTAPYTGTGGVNKSVGYTSNTSPPPSFFNANENLQANIPGAGE